jgi:hypothetical protein
MQNIGYIKLSEALNTGLRQFLVLAMHSHSQFSCRHLTGAVNIPFEWLKEDLSPISASSNSILSSENKSDKTMQAQEQLYKYGITNVATLCGDIKAWSTEMQFS